MSKVSAYAAKSNDGKMQPFSIERRDVQPKDVKIDILYCGVCHSDLHAIKNDWGNSTYPLVPGHEIIGRVIDVGSEVTNYSKGD
ncbi:MAG: putative zinc-type alcohol dehydrogenase-like protein, partial [Flavobacteriales bacterium]